MYTHEMCYIIAVTWKPLTQHLQDRHVTLSRFQVV